ncbi:hypothetical protein BC826DRAFT_99529 [Russula brevipes]|nr:hypothetical protein BC826DRAFT_99529 [Russula brevipes]
MTHPVPSVTNQAPPNPLRKRVPCLVTAFDDHPARPGVVPSAVVSVIIVSIYPRAMSECIYFRCYTLFPWVFLSSFLFISVTVKVESGVFCLAKGIKWLGASKRRNDVEVLASDNRLK